MKILIIERDANYSEQIKTVLSSFGYDKIEIAADFQSAKIAFEMNQPSLIFVDMVHESSQAIDLVTEFKKVKDLPVVFLVSQLDETIIEETKTTEPIGFVSKPIDENHLKAIISLASNVYSKLSKNIDNLKEQLNMAMLQVDELTETNSHLITATFRERALKQELGQTKALIEAQSKKIVDSINYSLRIQQSIIPSSDTFEEALGNHCVFYKPKDVVSGDFPWLMRKDNYVYYGAIDCTGHGVPGAMMSMIGNLLLNAIVQNGTACKTPSEVLAELHKAVVKTLKQDAEGNKAADGMDAALCRIDFEKKELLFSGAHLPLLLLRDGELETFKGDKFPVGGMQYRNRNTYSDHTIQLQDKDRVFVFSDGIIDQVGGEENMKWMTSRLKEFIVENKHVPMTDFKETISQKFDDFKGEHKQVDDVLLIGIEI